MRSKISVGFKLLVALILLVALRCIERLKSASKRNALFDNDQAINGDITNLIKLYDAGTEVDEYAGAGSNQAPRQSGSDTGTEENNPVTQITPPSHVPSISEMIKLTISAN